MSNKFSETIKNFNDFCVVCDNFGEKPSQSDLMIFERLLKIVNR